MEVVIKIDEIEYEHLISKEKFRSLEKRKQEWLVNKTLNRVKDGKKLPKGHGDLIDRDKLRPYQFDRNYIHVDDLDNAPTIIEADKAESEG